LRAVGGLLPPIDLAGPNRPPPEDIYRQTKPLEAGAFAA
jgi:hypothetical protein